MSISLNYATSRLFFRTLTLNGLFSLVSGSVMLTAAEPLGRLLGLAEPRWWLPALGAMLIAFGAGLVFRASYRRITRVEALVISALDLAWVIGSIMLLLALPGLFSTAGIVVVLAVAAIVLVFFDLQSYALWKSRPAAR